SKIAINTFQRNESITYYEIDRKSNVCARALYNSGVRKGTRIGIMLPNRIEFPILWFAIAKLGAIMVPINMRYTPREIEYVLNDTQASIAFVDKSVLSTFLKMDPWPQSISDKQLIVVG